jgi:hypothetical protein
MKTPQLFLAIALAAFVPPVAEADDFLDRLNESLTFTGYNDKVRARVSGTLDLEGYVFEGTPPGLIQSTGDNLFNPRLSLFFDGQLGPQVYVFVQARLDRGFDPSDSGARGRIDEYAVRFTPWEDGRLNIQIGQFATVFGRWVERHLSWDNPFLNGPLIYENVTAVEDAQAPPEPRLTIGEPVEKYEYNPVIWGPSYASGVSVAGKIGQFDYAAEVKNASLSSRPEQWYVTRRGFDNPTFSGRLGFRPNETWNFGVSASDGAYFTSQAAPTLPFGRDICDYHETVVGQDISFAWHHLQLWAEFIEARFEIPGFGDADTFAYFLEAKYKFAPQLFGALRWNQQFFGDVPDRLAGGTVPWGRDLWRVDAAVGYRFTAHTQLKVQYSVQRDAYALQDLTHMLGAQFTIRF